jgi:F420-non-reducing hydrogenase large subunit
MGTVDARNQVNFYDGAVRVVDPTGQEYTKFAAAEYLDVIREHVEPWTYAKLPYLKDVGWKGLVDGPDSGIYRVGPLARLNAAEGMATPLADEAYQQMYRTLGGRPVHSTLAFHWARLIELIYAAERAMELVTDEEITSTHLRNKPGRPGEGVGIVEAARGTLVHHYQLDAQALTKKVNLVVATVNNNPAICMSIRDAAKGLIHGGKVDPVGQMPLEARLYDAANQLVQVVRR